MIYCSFQFEGQRERGKDGHKFGGRLEDAHGAFTFPSSAGKGVRNAKLAEPNHI